jgi:NAD(P)H-quinone oxidoreductase subunit 6
MTIASTTQLICFVALSAAVAIGALGVVLLPNIVYSAFLLGGVFLSVAGLYLLLNASFVAAAQVLVYVGAVNVLILFAIMLVNKQGKPRRLSQAWPCVGCCRARCVRGLFVLLRAGGRSPPPGPCPNGHRAVCEEATIRIGEHLFSDYLLPFELASVLLLMAMIGAIVLARRGCDLPAM